MNSFLINTALVLLIIYLIVALAQYVITTYTYYKARKVYKAQILTMRAIDGESARKEPTSGNKGPTIN